MRLRTLILTFALVGCNSSGGSRTDGGAALDGLTGADADEPISMCAEQGSEDTGAACSDGCSNDGDRFADCDDFDCCSVVQCGPGTACYDRITDAGVDAASGSDGGGSAITCFGGATPTGPADSPVAGVEHAYTSHHGYSLELVFTNASPAMADFLRSGYKTVSFRLQPTVLSYQDYLAAKRYWYVGGPPFGSFDSTSWDVRSVTFSELRFASAPGRCDGRAKGRLTGADFLGGMSRAHSIDFDIPIDRAQSELFNPNCAASGAPYSIGVDCCSGWITSDGQGKSICA